MNMKNMTTKTATVAVLASLLVAPAGASGVGTTGASFLKVGVGARPMAMGNAFVAVADDANAINWNPGALGLIQHRNATLSYNSLFQDQNQGFLAAAVPMQDGQGTLGVGLNYLIVTDIEKRAADTENPDSTFNNQNMALSLSYGRAEVMDGLAVGGSFKYIRETLDSFTGNAVALDLGTVYKTPVENLTAGFTAMNLGTKIGPDPLPMGIKTGVAYKMFSQKLVLASDVDYLPLDERFYYDAGFEFWANKALAIRSGYQLGRRQDRLGGLTGFGAGLGFRLERIKIDYAFVPFGDLGDTHRMTLGLRF